MATVNTVEYIYKVDDGDYNQGLKEMSSNTDDLDTKSTSLSGTLNVLNNTYVKIAGAIGGFVVAMNKSTNAILTNSLNYSELQNNLDLTDAQTKELTKSQEKLGIQYGFTRKEVAQVSALNSEYVSSTEDLAKANELAFQTANAYALKEGDLSVSTDQLITSTEGLRDVILTGSTTAFEDAGLSLEGYRDNLIEVSGATEKQIEEITKDSNGIFEYTEALSKAADPQQRFEALVLTSNEGVSQLTDNLGFAGQASLTWQQNITKLQNVLGTLVKTLVFVIAKVIQYSLVVTQAIVNSKLFQAVISILVPVIQFLINTLQTLITQLVVQLAPAFVLVGQTVVLVFQALKPLIVAVLSLAQTIGSFLLPILSVLISIFTIIATIIISALTPVIVTLANIISTVLTPIIQVLNLVLQPLVPLLNFIAVVMQNLAVIINSVLVVAFGLLNTVIQAIFTPFRVLNDLVNQGISYIRDLASSINNALIGALENVLNPIQKVIDIFQRLLQIILDITDAILGGLIGAFNSIPFVPNIGGSSANIANYGAPSNQSTKNYNNNVNYSINYKKAPSLRELRREQRMTINHGGTYVT